MIQVVRGQRLHHIFHGDTAPDPTKTVMVNPGRTVIGTANGAPKAALRETGQKVYDAAILPSEEGRYHVEWYDQSGNLLEKFDFESVRGLDRHHSHGFSPYNGLVPIYPDRIKASNTDSTATAVVVGAASPYQRSFISTGKALFPCDCTVFALDILAQSMFNPAGAVDWFVGAVDTTTAGKRRRSRCENLNDSVPTNGAWGSLGNFGWYHVELRRPFVARAGDAFLMAMDDSAGDPGNSPLAPGQRTCFRYQASTTDAIAAGQRIEAMVGIASDSQDNTFAQFGSVTGQFAVRFYIAPPMGVVAGHSIWANSYGYSTVYANRDDPYSRSQDFAAFISDVLGEPWINCAWGGTNLDNWVGGPASWGTTAANLYENLVAPLHPAFVLYDSLYNDHRGGTIPTPERTLPELYQLYDRLAVHADQQGTQLILIDPYNPQNTVTLEWIDGINNLRRAMYSWASVNGVPVIPLYHRLGDTYLSTDPPDARQKGKRFGTDHADWGLPDYQANDTVHGYWPLRKAAATAVAQWFSMRYPAGSVWSHLRSRDPMMAVRSAVGSSRGAR